MSVDAKVRAAVARSRSQAQIDRAEHEARKCRVCGAAGDIYQTHGAVRRADGSMGDCPNVGALREEWVRPSGSLAAAIAAEFVGFERCDTGGGCSALVLDHGETRSIITRVDDPSAPESLEEIVVLGFEDWDGAHSVEIERLSLAETLLAVYGPVAGEPLPVLLEACRGEGR